MKSELKFGLIGHNVGYSRSADIFHAILDIKDINGRFDVFDLSPEDFDHDFPELLREPIDGLSVTIPFKNTVIPHLHDIAPVAQALDAVNSISVRDGKTCGFNTDCYGFGLPLRQYADRLKHRTAIIIGCGGAARAATYSLYADFEVRRFLVVGREISRLRQFQSLLTGQIPGMEMEVCTVARAGMLKDEEYEIAVNCTPLGGANHAEASPLQNWFNRRKGKIYYDLNYNAGNQPVKQALEKGMTAIDGSAMLVGQALRSLSLWCGIEQEFDPVYRAVFGDHKGIHGGQ